MNEQAPRGPFREKKPIILASASPRRQRLLASLGIGFEVLASNVKEPLPKSGEDPRSYALSTALLKAREVSRQRPDALVLGADTIVVLDGRILGKPDSADHAFQMLEMLSDREHEVITGCCIMRPSLPDPREFAVSTRVRMQGFSREALRAYARSPEPMDKAGAYAIQGVGGIFVRDICGSFTNVVGLPLQEVAAALLQLEALEVSTH